MTKNENFNFSNYQSELENIVNRLQEGTLTIDESIDKFKRAQYIITELEKHLKQAENIIKKIN